jgi:glycine betaine/proline transport system substrate-binding protein
MAHIFSGRFTSLALVMALVMVFSIGAIACATAAEPQTIEVTKIVEKPVEVTKIVTEQVEVEVTKVVTEQVEVTKIVEVAPDPGPRDTIVFSDLNWTSAQVQNRIAQYVVEKGYGFPTDIISGGTLPLFAGLQKGDTHVTMEIWLPNQSIGWEKAVELGEVVSVGKSLVGDWQSTFVIPAYVAEQHPDLMTPQDLMKDEYKELFATTDSRGNARLVGCVPGWSCELVNEAQIEAYGLVDHLHVINPGSQDAMFAEIFGAYEKQEPWLGYMWGTGDPALKLDLVRLEEPAYSQECWDSDKACAFDDSLVLVAVHKSLLPRAPEVIAFLQNWEFTIDIYKGIFQWQDANEGSNEEAAVFWLKENEDIWGGWVTEEAAQAIKAALAAGEIPEGWPTN